MSFVCLDTSTARALLEISIDVDSIIITAVAAQVSRLAWFASSWDSLHSPLLLRHLLRCAQFLCAFLQFHLFSLPGPLPFHGPLSKRIPYRIPECKMNDDVTLRNKRPPTLHRKSRMKILFPRPTTLRTSKRLGVRPPSTTDHTCTNVSRLSLSLLGVLALSA